MTLSPQQVWEVSLGQIQLQVPRSSYDTWLKGTYGLTLEGDSLTIAVPSTFAAEWLQRRMYQLIQQAVTEVAARPLQIHFQIASLSQATSTASRVPPEVISRQVLPLAEDSILGNEPSQRHAFNPRYTFDSFVVGRDNQLAHAAATAVAERPGEQYNPLFIYSGVGLGKTHLLYAIASSIAQRNLTPVYVTTEQFTNEFILAIRERKTEEFRTKYRSADALLMDDIQFLAGKEQTQEGFFHTFNDLHNANRQIVVACDRPPKSVTLLEDRLRSRFEWGLIADIQPPQLETRIAILQTKALALRIQLGDGVARAIARRASHSIRELEGQLNRVAAMAHFLGKPISLDVVNTALATVSPEPSTPAITAAEVLQRAASHYGIPVQVLCSRPPDHKRTTHPQKIVMYILGAVLNHPTAEIATLLGAWHKKTVANTLKQIAVLISQDNRLSNEVNEILHSLQLPQD